MEPGAVVALAEGQAAVQVGPVVDLAVAVQVVLAEVEPEAGQLEEVQVPGQAAAVGLEPALAQLQGQASARGRQPRSALVQMRPSALALAPQLGRVRPAVPGWVPVPVRPSVPALEVRSVKGPVTDPVTEPGTKVPGLKTEPVLERLRSDRQDRIMEQSGTSSVTLCSMI